MGEAGYAHAQSDFDAEKNARATFQLYEEILDEKART